MNTDAEKNLSSSKKADAEARALKMIEMQTRAEAMSDKEVEALMARLGTRPGDLQKQMFDASAARTAVIKAMRKRGYSWGDIAFHGKISVVIAKQAINKEQRMERQRQRRIVNKRNLEREKRAARLKQRRMAQDGLPARDEEE